MGALSSSKSERRTFYARKVRASWGGVDEWMRGALGNVITNLKTLGNCGRKNRQSSDAVRA